MILFFEGIRTDPNPGYHGERTYEFLNRVAGDVWDNVRAHIEDLLEQVKEAGAQRELVSRLRDGSGDEFTAAWWELYLHESFRRAGYHVQPHPPTPSGRKPDFLVSSPESSFYVEATSQGSTPASRAKHSRREDFLRILNEIPAGPWVLWLERLTVGAQPIAARSVASKVTAWLDSLPIKGPDRIDDWKDRPVLEIDTPTGWSMRISVGPRSIKPLPPGRRPRAIGIYPVESGFSQPSEPIRAALSKKYRKYGALEHPLLIAIYIPGMLHDQLAVEGALFGDLALEVAVAPHWVEIEPESRWVRQSNGFWTRGDAWANAHVGGVIIANDQLPWMTARRAPELWLHPDGPMPTAPVPVWAAHRVTPGGDIEELPAERTPQQYFGLSQDWPGEAF